MNLENALDSRVSLYTPHAIAEKRNRSLLIQLLLHELIEACKILNGIEQGKIATFHPRFFPYDWALQIGHLNKMHEHSLLLRNSFPEKLRETHSFPNFLFKTLSSKKYQEEYSPSILQQVYQRLEPFIEVCKDSENLLFFLLKNRVAIDTLKGQNYLLGFIMKIYACGLETLGEKMCDKYHRRGFFSQIPEFKLLLSELSHV